MRYIRWKVYRALCVLGWWVCPEPQRTHIQNGVGSWEEVLERSRAKESSR